MKTKKGCQNLIKKLNGKVYCTHPKHKREVTPNDCRNCELIEYALKEQTKLKSNIGKKPIKSQHRETKQFNKDNSIKNNKCSLNRKKTPLKQRTYKQAKLEKNRFSIFTDDLEHCYLSKLYFNKEVKKDDLHEIFGGSKRLISIKWGLVLPVTREFHNDKEILKQLKIMGQKKAMEYYKWSKDDFRKIFGRNYLN